MKKEPSIEGSFLILKDKILCVLGACAHHYFGDDVKHLVVTSAAAC